MRRRRGSVLRGLVELVLLVVGIALLGLFVGLARGAEDRPAPRKGEVCELTRLEGKELVERRVRVLDSMPLTAGKTGAVVRVLDADFDAGWIVPADELRRCRA